MAENVPEPEKQPRVIVLTCDSCHEDFRAPIENTVNYVFTDEPQYSVVCIQHLNEDCDHWNSVFHDQHLPLLADIASEYPTSIYQKLHDLDDDEPATVSWITEQRLELENSADYDPPQTPEVPKPLEAHNLTVRQENYIQHWGEFLQKMVIDVSDFTNES